MSWVRVMAPMAGGARDREALAAAAVVAEPFGAEVAAIYTPGDVADVVPWVGEGDAGAVQATAVDALREAAVLGERKSRLLVGELDYPKKVFAALPSPVWANLSAEARLSDVVVFDTETTRGRTPLAEAFQQLMVDEQRPVLIARPGLVARGVVAVAWDGGKEASRAARLVLPLLEHASRVVLLAAPKAGNRKFDPARLQAYYAGRGVHAEIETLSATGDVGPALIEASQGLGANLLVAGAFGHPRLQEYIFGGTTRALLNAAGPSLFLSH